MAGLIEGGATLLNCMPRLLYDVDIFPRLSNPVCHEGCSLNIPWKIKSVGFASIDIIGTAPLFGLLSQSVLYSVAIALIMRLSAGPIGADREVAGEI